MAISSTDGFGAEAARDAEAAGAAGNAAAPALRSFDVEEVGSSAFIAQHHDVERLNQQTHHSAQTNSEDFVLEALLTFEKLPLLVRDLLATEAWTEFVFPLLRSRAAEHNSMRAYFTLYHEATVANLLETVLYMEHAAEAVGDAAIDLVDYCVRKVGYLVGQGT